MNNYLLKKSSYKNNEYILVLHPEVGSVNSLLNKIDFSELPNSSVVNCDFIIFVGDRTERYLEFKIEGGKINHKSITKGNKDDEAVSVTKDYYSELPMGYINKIYPISYRNIILNLKEEASTASS